MDYFTSDLHLDHIGMLRHRPIFSSMDEMNQTIIKAFDPVKKGDRVFLLGDIGWKKNTIEELFNLLIDKKKAIVFWIEGNHDHALFDSVDHKGLHKMQSIYIRGYGDYSPIFMSHYPQLLWEKSYHGAFLLHGHGHEDTADRTMLDNMVFGKRLNVNIEMNNYKLYTRDDVESYMKNMPENIDVFLVHGTEAQINLVNDTTKEIHEIISKMYQKLGNVSREVNKYE